MSGLIEQSPDRQSSFWLASQWFARALSERDAHHRFSSLAHALKSHPRLAVLCSELEGAAADEKRHIGLCMKQVQRFGGPALRDYKGFTPYFHSVLCELVTLFCVMETINAALLLSLKECLSDNSLRETCHEILRDEVQHARIGWAALSLSTSEERDVVWNHLPQIFQAAGVDKVDKDDANFDHTAAEWGLFDRAQRVAILTQTMNEVIFPGFWQMGLGKEIDWKQIQVQLSNH
ncbi:MAG: ferritin-like domain-containing protein [Myxococcota bacterium]|nr:ferritin-like domain-containing protein [Myxococcota bacterium]